MTFKIEAESADGVRVTLVLEAPREQRPVLWKLMAGATACFDEVLGRHRIVAVESCDKAATCAAGEREGGSWIGG